MDSISQIPRTSRMIKTLVVIGGPTAIGKTGAGIALAKRYQSEIISADSRQIYRETRIGTAVPTQKELSEVPHHFIRFISLNDYYNASKFEVDVLKKLEQLFRVHDVVFMVGGSGMYIDAVCFGIDELPEVDQEIRAELSEIFHVHGIERLRSDLKRLDPETYKKVDLNNHYRILKALEVTIQTGRPYSSFLTHQKRKRNFRITRLALDMEREALYQRINERVDRMLNEGLVEEVRSLQSFRQKNAMKTVGYRELFLYLDGELSLEAATDLIKRNTRKYARKQLTWFRKNNLYPWFHPAETDRMDDHIRRSLEKG